jgi:hypothetical protein
VSVEAQLKLSSSSGSAVSPAPLRGVVTNLSTMGLSIRLSEVHPIGTNFRVILQLKDKECFLFATVRRVYPATAYDPTHFGHGLQIVAASDESIEMIYEYMMNVTGRTAAVEANTVEAFPAAVNAGSTSAKADPPSSLPQLTL